MRNTSKIILFGGGILLILGLFFIPFQADAAGLVPCGGEGEPACDFCDILQLGDNIVTFFLFPSAELGNGIGIVPLVAGLLFAVGGIFLLFGAGNPSFYEKGKQTLTAVVIGLLIVYGAWVFINTFLTFIGFVNFTGPGAGWWQISCGI